MPWIDQSEVQLSVFRPNESRMIRFRFSSSPQGWFIIVHISRYLLMDAFTNNQNKNNNTKELNVWVVIPCCAY